jgi:hypothetical protein
MDMSRANEHHSLRLLKVSPANLFLDPNNPRIAVTEEDNKKYTPEQIISERVQASVLRRISHEQNHIPELKKSILKSGFIEKLGPLIVKRIAADKYIMLEGNRRLTAVKEILSNENGLNSTIKNSLKKIEVSEFIYSKNDEFLEEEIIEMLLAKIHIAGPLAWGAMEKASYTYNSYLRVLRKELQSDVDDSSFILDSKLIDEVCDIYSFKNSEAKRNVLVYRIFKQLKDNKYDVPPSRFTLIELAASDAALSYQYFGLSKKNWLFDNPGLDRFYRLCVAPGSPVKNPPDFKKFSTIFKKGTSTDVENVLNGESSISAAYADVKERLDSEGVVRRLNAIIEKIEKINLVDFCGDSRETKAISRIVDLANNKLKFFIGDNIHQSRSELEEDVYQPDTAAEALRMEVDDLRFLVLDALRVCPKGTCVSRKFPTIVIKHLGIRSSGEPRRRLVSHISKQINYLVDYRLIEKYNNGSRYRLLA